MSARLIQAFASAKERNEAAFVAFVTAGYPEKKGKAYDCCGGSFCVSYLRPRVLSLTAYFLQYNAFMMNAQIHPPF
jgi:hypothetical protein